MNKRLWLIVKIVVLAMAFAFIAWKLTAAWREVEDKQIPIDWQYAGIGLLGFMGSMISSALVWRWLTLRMGDRSGRTIPMLGAYTFSQMGKYVPGKVALLLMRIERTGRFGMSPQICALSTLLENALYMISGGIVGMLAIVRIMSELRAEGKVSATQEMLVWPLVAISIGVLAGACHPRFFYGLVNKLLRKMKREEVPPNERLGLGTLIVAALLFIPCWVCGGFSLWASAMCVHEVALEDCLWFPGAFALSVIVGMASLLPGGLVVREGVLGAAVSLQFVSKGMPQNEAVVLAAVAVALQRLFQVAVEVVLGLLGWSLTGLRRK